MKNNTGRRVLTFLLAVLLVVSSVLGLPVLAGNAMNAIEEVQELVPTETEETAGEVITPVETTPDDTPEASDDQEKPLEEEVDSDQEATPVEEKVDSVTEDQKEENKETNKDSDVDVKPAVEAIPETEELKLADAPIARAITEPTTVREATIQKLQGLDNTFSDTATDDEIAEAVSANATKFRTFSLPESVTSPEGIDLLFRALWGNACTLTFTNENQNDYYLIAKSISGKNYKNSKKINYGDSVWSYDLVLNIIGVDLIPQGDQLPIPKITEGFTFIDAIPETVYLPVPIYVNNNSALLTSGEKDSFDAMEADGVDEGFVAVREEEKISVRGLKQGALVKSVYGGSWWTTDGATIGANPAQANTNWYFQTPIDVKYTVSIEPISYGAAGGHPNLATQDKDTTTNYAVVEKDEFGRALNTTDKDNGNINRGTNGVSDAYSYGTDERIATNGTAVSTNESSVTGAQRTVGFGAIGEAITVSPNPADGYGVAYYNLVVFDPITGEMTTNESNLSQAQLEAKLAAGIQGKTKIYVAYTKSDSFYKVEVDDKGSVKPITEAPEFTVYDVNNAVVGKTTFDANTGEVKLPALAMPIQQNTDTAKPTQKDNTQVIYTMKETKAPAGYKENKAIYTLTLHADGTLDYAEKGGDKATLGTYNGKVSISNERASTEVELVAEKTIDGTPAANQEFEFGLYEENSDTLVKDKNGKDMLVKNEANGKITFEKLRYLLADIKQDAYQTENKNIYKRTFNYTMKEVQDQKLKDIVLFDTKSVPVVVTITYDADKDTFESTVTYDGKAGVTFENELKKVSISGIKTWNDFENELKLRPDNIVVQISTNGTTWVEPQSTQEKETAFIRWSNKESSVWSYTITNLPNYNRVIDENTGVVSYQKLTYTVREVANEIYDSVETVVNPVQNSGTGVWEHADFTNNLQMVTFTGTKTWVDQSDAFKLRPDSISLSLKQMKDGQGTEAGKDITLQSTNQDMPYYLEWKDTDTDMWSYTIHNLPKSYLENSQKHDYSYDVIEKKVNAYKEPQYTTAGTNQKNITNTLDTVRLQGAKFWNLPQYVDMSKLPDITLTFYQGTKLLTVPSSNIHWTKVNGNWTYTVEQDFPRFDANGDPYVYTVRETPVNGYICPTGAFGQLGEINNGIITIQTIENKLAVTEFGGTKTWLDKENAEGNRPTDLTLTLKAVAGGKDLGFNNQINVVDSEEQIDLNKMNLVWSKPEGSNTWTYRYVNMPTYTYDGKDKIIYTVEEQVVNGYIQKTEDGDFTNLDTVPYTPGYTMVKERTTRYSQSDISKGQGSTVGVDNEGVQPYSPSSDEHISALEGENGFYAGTGHFIDYTTTLVNTGKVPLTLTVGDEWEAKAKAGFTFVQIQIKDAQGNVLTTYDRDSKEVKAAKVEGVALPVSSTVYVVFTCVINEGTAALEEISKRTDYEVRGYENTVTTTATYDYVETDPTKPNFGQTIYDVTYKENAQGAVVYPNDTDYQEAKDTKTSDAKTPVMINVGYEMSKERTTRYAESDLSKGKGTICGDATDGINPYDTTDKSHILSNQGDKGFYAGAEGIDYTVRIKNTGSVPMKIQVSDAWETMKLGGFTFTKIEVKDYSNRVTATYEKDSQELINAETIVELPVDKMLTTEDEGVTYVVFTCTINADTVIKEEASIGTDYEVAGYENTVTTKGTYEVKDPATGDTIEKVYAEDEHGKVVDPDTVGAIKEKTSTAKTPVTFKVGYTMVKERTTRYAVSDISKGVGSIAGDMTNGVAPYQSGDKSNILSGQGANGFYAGTNQAIDYTATITNTGLAPMTVKVSDAWEEMKAGGFTFTAITVKNHKGETIYQANAEEVANAAVNVELPVDDASTKEINEGVVYVVFTCTIQADTVINEEDSSTNGYPVNGYVNTVTTTGTYKDPSGSENEIEYAEDENGNVVDPTTENAIKEKKATAKTPVTETVGYTMVKERTTRYATSDVSKGVGTIAGDMTNGVKPYTKGSTTNVMKEQGSKGFYPGTGKAIDYTVTLRNTGMKEMKITIKDAWESITKGGFTFTKIQVLDYNGNVSKAYDVNSAQVAAAAVKDIVLPVDDTTTLSVNEGMVYVVFTCTVDKDTPSKEENSNGGTYLVGGYVNTVTTTATYGPEDKEYKDKDGNTSLTSTAKTPVMVKENKVTTPTKKPAITKPTTKPTTPTKKPTTTTTKKANTTKTGDETSVMKYFIWLFIAVDVAGVVVVMNLKRRRKYHR